MKKYKFKIAGVLSSLLISSVSLAGNLLKVECEAVGKVEQDAKAFIILEEQSEGSFFAGSFPVIDLDGLYIGGRFLCEVGAECRGRLNGIEVVGELSHDEGANYSFKVNIVENEAAFICPILFIN